MWAFPHHHEPLPIPEEGFPFPQAFLRLHRGSLGPQLPCLQGPLLVPMSCSLVSKGLFFFLSSLGFSLSSSLWDLWTLVQLCGSLWLSFCFFACFLIPVNPLPQQHGLLFRSPSCSSSLLLCPRAAWAGRRHAVVEGVAWGWALHPMQGLLLISILLAAPQP